MSTFLVLQTAVTSVPSALAIWTANDPTPPDAPLIRTRCPGFIRPFRRPCIAVQPAVGSVAASSKDRLAGFDTSAVSGAAANSAYAPKPHRESSPNTSSPGRNPVTFRPTASTLPAMSLPMILNLGVRSPATSRKGSGVPRSRCQSPAFAAAA